MFCSACGHALEAGQPVCPQCGRPVAPAVAPMPPVPNLDFQLQNYSSRIRALSIVWYVYGGLSLVLSAAGMFFANAWLHGGFGPWSHGPWGHGPFGPEFLGPAFLHFVWAYLVVRSALAIAAGWGLMERAPLGPRGGDRGSVLLHPAFSHRHGTRHLDTGYVAGLSQHRALRPPLM